MTPSGGRRGVLESREVVEVAAPYRGAGGGERGGRRIGSRETDHLMTRVEELGDDGGADVAGRAGDEYTHEAFS